MLSGKGPAKPTLKSVRNPTPAPENKKNEDKPSHKTERVEGSKTIDDENQVEKKHTESCQNCVHLQETINQMHK